MGEFLEDLGFAFGPFGSFFGDLTFAFFLDGVFEGVPDFLFFLCFLLLGMVAFCICWNDRGTSMASSMIAVCFLALGCKSWWCCSMVDAWD